MNRGLPRGASILINRLNLDNRIARVRRETKGRGGKTVTTVTGVLLNADDLKALAKRLKNRCGCGGAVKDGIIEIQGDKVDQVCELLVAEGFKVKRAGG